MIPPAHPATLSAMGSDAGRFKRGFRQLRNAPCTWQLVRILLMIQAIPVIWERVVPDSDKLRLTQEFFGLARGKFLNGDFWEPLSYAFIHANWAHLFTNIACLILLGPKLEHIISKRSFWLVTLSSLLAGGLFFLCFSPPTLPNSAPQILVGVSAVCFGFLVLLTTLSPGSKFLPLFISGRGIGLAIIVTNLTFTLLNPDLPTGLLAAFGRKISESGYADIFQISHACHLGGSIAGFLYGKWLLRPRVTLARLQKQRAKKEARR